MAIKKENKMGREHWRRHMLHVVDIPSGTLPGCKTQTLHLCLIFSTSFYFGSFAIGVGLYCGPGENLSTKPKRNWGVHLAQPASNSVFYHHLSFGSLFMSSCHFFSLSWIVYMGGFIAFRRAICYLGCAFPFIRVF